MSDLISFSIRNKSKTPIVTYSKKTMELFLKSHPETICNVLSSHSHSYKQYTGKPLVLEHEQHLILNEYYGADETGMWTSLTSKLPYNLMQANWVFTKGIASSCLVNTLEEIYSASEAFYTAIFNAAGLKRNNE